MGRRRKPRQTRQSSTRCLALLQPGNCHPFVNTPHNQPCRMEMAQVILLCPPFLPNWETSITSPRPLQLETRPFHSPLQRDLLHASRRFLDMVHHPNHQMILSVENYLHLAEEDTSTSMQTAIGGCLRLMVHNIRALAIIAVATRRLQVRISQAPLLRRWPLTG